MAQNSSNFTIKILLTLILGALIVICSAYVYNTFKLSEPQITGKIVSDNYMENDNVKNFNDESFQSSQYVEENKSEVVEEKIVKPTAEEPKKIEYETFTVYLGAGNEAVFLYDLTYSDVEPEHETYTIIDFNSEKSYKGYDELVEYIKNSNIEIVIIYTWDKVNGEDKINELATNIRRSTGVSVIAKFASGERFRSTN